MATLHCSVCADITLVVLYILLDFLCVFQFVVDSCADESVNYSNTLTFLYLPIVPVLSDRCNFHWGTHEF